MRELKFRAWEVKKKKIVYGIKDIFGWKVTGNVIMQFTGLKDKNGKEIYEGDIIHYSSGEQDNIPSFYIKQCVVTFHNGSFMLNSINMGDINSDTLIHRYRSVDSGGDVYYENNSFKIVGNIYQNKNLLKEDKE